MNSNYYPCQYCGNQFLNIIAFDMHNCVFRKQPIRIPIVPEDAVVPQVVYGTTVRVKQENFDKFAQLISNQFNHGGDKYKLPGFADREATDVISSVFGGASEFDWVLGTMMKYLFRFKNFHREKDLLKIATYCYILWLKQGNHLKENADEDTNK